MWQTRRYSLNEWMIFCLWKFTKRGYSGTHWTGTTRRHTLCPWTVLCDSETLRFCALSTANHLPPCIQPADFDSCFFPTPALKLREISYSRGDVMTIFCEAWQPPPPVWSAVFSLTPPPWDQRGRILFRLLTTTLHPVGGNIWKQAHESIRLNYYFGFVFAIFWPIRSQLGSNIFKNGNYFLISI